MYSPKTRLLVVDPEPVFTHLLRLDLERTGHFEVMEANCAEFGLLAARFFHPDVILLHPALPRTSGLDVAMDLRTRLPESSARIVFMTAAVRDAIKGSSRQPGLIPPALAVNAPEMPHRRCA